MSKKQCKRDKPKKIKKSKRKYTCKKCGLGAKKTERLCKPAKTLRKR